MKKHCLVLATASVIGGAGASHAAPILRITEAMSNGDTADWFEVTNFGDTAADITNYRMDDNSYLNSASLPLAGVTSIAPGESVVFVEGTAATPTSNVSTFKTNWGLGAAVQVGGYGGSQVGLSSTADGVTLFTNTTANGGTELSGPFSGLIRISFGAATTGTSFNWTYDAAGNSTSPAAGQLTTSGISWTNGASAMLGTPGSVPPPAPVVTIAATDASASEAGTDPGTFRISRTGSTANALTLNYTVATGAGQATAADYTPSLTGTAVIPAGQAFVDVTITPVDDVLLEGSETVALTLVDTANYDLGATVSAVVTINDNETSVNLSRYVRIGRYDLPEPTRTTPPANSLLCQEASNVTYNWDTDTLFITGDGGTSVVQVSKTGQLIDSMTLAQNASRPQGGEFYDTEGLTYIGGGQFVMTEERDRTLNKFTYVAGSTLQRANTQTVKLGTTIGNVGLEGVCYDPQTSAATPGFIVVKEKTPKGIFQTNVDFNAGTATNGSPTTVESTDLFDPALIPTLDHSDIFALSNLPALVGTPASSHLLVISQESGQIVHVDRAGNVSSTLTIAADPGSPLSVPDMTMEGVTMDRNGVLYVTNENGGGDANHPQLWVYAPSNATDLPPTAVALQNPVSSIAETSNTTEAIKLADIAVTDDGLGVNTFSVSGADAASFEIVGTALFLKAGVTLNAATKPTYGITVNVDDTSVGGTPDASTNYTLTITSGTAGAPNLVITEVAPWSSSNGIGLLADWFEVTNFGASSVNLASWKMDDSGPSFATAVALNGITSIAPGESVIFIEAPSTSQADLDAKAAAFRSLWFGGSPPAGLKIGSYSGSGVGLSTAGDGVNLFDAGGAVQASVSFGAASAGPFFSFDNSAGLNNAALTTLSAVGTNGAFAASGDSNEIGSPGTLGGGATPLVSIVATDAGASETGADPGTFRISRTGSTVGALTANYTIATGSGQADSADYTPALTGAAIIPAGQSFVDLTITPVDDSLVEGAETITLTLGDTGSYDVGSPANATITISDNDVANLPPTAVALNNKVTTITENTPTTAAVKVADIAVADDGQGTNNLAVTGADAAFFQITGSALYLKTGTTLNFATKPAYNVNVEVDDTTVGSTPDASVAYSLAVIKGVVPGSIVISEVAPWSSASSPIAVDWFEVTNTGTTAANISNWKMDDNSHVFANAVALSGVTSIAPGESVIFMETTDLPGKKAAFLNLWFGANPPASLQIGSYSGGGVGLSGTADEVSLFDSSGNLITGVGFGASPALNAPAYFTFDNKAGLGSSTLPLPTCTTFSAAGVNGAFAAVNDAIEIGSPGTTYPVTFLGVSSGDADSTSATLWTRINETIAPVLSAQVSADLAFTAPVSFNVAVDPAKDYTAKVAVTGLTPGTKYYYRFVVGGSGETSLVGTFKTAPAPTAAAPLHFAFSGDMDGLIRPYALASVVPAQNLDFYVNLGDVIYENASNLAASGAHNGAPWLNSPSVTLSNDSLSFNGVPRAFIPAGTPFATQAQLKADYQKKYRENFLPVNTGGQSALRDFYAAQGNYTTWDNHELGNRKYIDGGAPAGGSVGGAAGTDMPSGRGVDARDNGAGNPGNINDVNTSSTDIMNRSVGFQTLRDVFVNYQPIADRGTITAPADPRTDGSKRLYSAQQWGKNATYINTDARSYRDIRLKNASAGADDTGTRADNPNRTYLGATQVAWLKQTLLDAHNAGTVWKFVSISDPIDQIGPIGGALSLSNLPSFGAGSTYAPVNADGGKAFMGGYRAERNALLKFIVDNKITNVVFLSTDDHQNRINEITYSPTGQLGTQSSYVKVPYCFSIVCGPLGATGPDLITNHTFSMAQQYAASIFTAQQAAGVEPLGLIGYPGLKNLQRVGDPTASTSPQAVDFYSPDTFNFTTLDVSADGKTLSVNSVGMDATGQNSGIEYANGPQAQTIFSFQIDAPTPVETWRAYNFGIASNTGNAADTADYDNDGIPNLVEYALGTNPASAAGTDGPAALPVGSVNSTDPLLDDRLALGFNLPDPGPSDITYIVQGSDDLGTWTDIASKTGPGPWTWLGGGISHIVTSGPAPVAGENGSVSVKVGDVVPGSENPRRMMRLKVSHP